MGSEIFPFYFLFHSFHYFCLYSISLSKPLSVSQTHTNRYSRTTSAQAYEHTVHSARIEHVIVSSPWRRQSGLAEIDARDIDQTARDARRARVCVGKDKATNTRPVERRRRRWQTQTSGPTSRGRGGGGRGEGGQGPLLTGRSAAKIHLHAIGPTDPR